MGGSRHDRSERDLIAGRRLLWKRNPPDPMTRRDLDPVPKSGGWDVVFHALLSKGHVRDAVPVSELGHRGGPDEVVEFFPTNALLCDHFGVVSQHPTGGKRHELSVLASLVFP